LSIPSFINGGKMFSSLFDQGEHYQAEELVRDAGLDNILDAFDQEYCEQSDSRERKDQSYSAFSEGKLRLGKVGMSVKISVLISFEDFVKDGVLGTCIVPYETRTIQRNLV
jgi:hypothetical protein